MRTKKPNRALKPTLDTTPMGALHDAFFVSSLKWADASNPARPVSTTQSAYTPLRLSGASHP